MTQVSGTFPQLSDRARKVVKPMMPMNRNMPDEFATPPPSFGKKGGKQAPKVNAASRSARLAAMNRAKAKMRSQMVADNAASNMNMGGASTRIPVPPGTAIRRAMSRSKAHGK